jgi:hypothetical protein
MNDPEGCSLLERHTRRLRREAAGEHAHIPAKALNPLIEKPEHRVAHL